LYGWQECRCPHACVEEEFQYETSRSTIDEEHCANCTESSEVVIFFSTHKMDAQAEEWKLPVGRLLGLVGGLSGLFLGASLVFLIELILLAIQLALIMIYDKDFLVLKKPNEARV
ncbi:hypothetical protein PMAYCL1PPCAC_03746, partial [Pristionchus mayeri]